MTEPKPDTAMEQRQLNWPNILKTAISGTFACHYQQNTFPGESEPCGECAHCKADKILGEGWEDRKFSRSELTRTPINASLLAQQIYSSLVVTDEDKKEGYPDIPEQEWRNACESLIVQFFPPAEAPRTTCTKIYEHVPVDAHTIECSACKQHMLMGTIPACCPACGIKFDKWLEDIRPFKYPQPQSMALSGWRDVKVNLPQDETGWLLEREANGQIEYIGVIDGMLNWTPDSLKALRLCRREDADALCEIVDDCWRVADHRWVQPLPAPPEGQSKEQP